MKKIVKLSLVIMLLFFVGFGFMGCSSEKLEKKFSVTDVETSYYKQGNNYIYNYSSQIRNLTNEDLSNTHFKLLVYDENGHPINKDNERDEKIGYFKPHAIVKMTFEINCGPITPKSCKLTMH